MFIYSTLYAKICDNKELKWPNRILDEIDKQFDDERSIEFSVMLGFCLNDIYCYLDKKWVIDNINYIMPAKNINHWKAAFTGYLYSKKLYPDVYILLKDNGHYYRAIHTDFEETDINDRISHHICEFYKHGIEKLDNGSLMMELINNGNLKHIFYIIHYFSRSKNDIKDMGIDIKPLWNILIEKCSEMETKDDIEYKKCISQLSLWINGVDTLDEQISDWLKQSIKNMDDMTANNPNFIDGLLYHVSKTPKIVGEIYIYMLKNNLYPIYSMDEIQKLVQELSNKGERSLALNICNICGMAGFDSFKLEFEKITNCK
jgi:hypothetical protein